MSRSRIHRAIVLKSVDVGDADRFCILFTREQGRVAARANGARKLLSRFHALQPGNLLDIELSGHGPHYRIIGVMRDGSPTLTPDVTSFTRTQKGLEILLCLLQDDDAFPAVFDDAARFLVLCHQEHSDPAPAFTLRVLSLLGMLPSTPEDIRYGRLHDIDRQAVHRVMDSRWYEHAADADTPNLRRFIEHILHDHLSGPLRAEHVSKAMLA